MLRGGKRSLQEPLTPKTATSSQIPIPRETATLPPAGRGGSGERPPGLPEKRAYACLSCSNAQVTPEAKIPKQAAKKVAPLMAKAIRDYKRRFSRR
ncbi:Elongin-A2 [Plecturocebus cupreus]